MAEHADLLVARNVFIQAEFPLAHRSQRYCGARSETERVAHEILSIPWRSINVAIFFATIPKIEPVPFYDTAGSVKHVVSEPS